MEPEEMSIDAEFDRPLRGADYPWLCRGCQLVVDQCAALVGEGEDAEDDDEAACNLAYDLRLFCGSFHCIRPPVEWLRRRMAETGIDEREVHRCRSCDRFAALTARAADALSLEHVLIGIHATCACGKSYDDPLTLHHETVVHNTLL